MTLTLTQTQSLNPDPNPDPSPSPNPKPNPKPILQQATAGRMCSSRGWTRSRLASRRSAPTSTPTRSTFSPGSSSVTSSASTSPYLHASRYISPISPGNFIALNLFIGAIVDNFIRIKAETDGSATMTDGQLQWVNTMKSMVSQKA